MLKVILACIVSVAVFGCQSRETTPLTVNDTLFDKGTIKGALVTKEMSEASGLTESIVNPGYLWTHNDSGNKAGIFLVDKEGILKTKIALNGISNRDWEAMASGPGPVQGKSYVYIGDIGDNDAKHKFKFVYRIEEPTIDTSHVTDTTLATIDQIKFQLPDGPRDSEAMMLDPLTQDIYIISKREHKVNVYRLPFPQSTTEPMSAELVLPQLELGQYVPKNVSSDGKETLINGYHSAYYNQIVSCDISPDGSEILVKSYSSIYYWKRKQGESIAETLKGVPALLPYSPEPQGEAVTFDLSGEGYYTLSEERGKLPQRLFFYKRK